MYIDPEIVVSRSFVGEMTSDNDDDRSLSASVVLHSKPTNDEISSNHNSSSLTLQLNYDEPLEQGSSNSLTGFDPDEILPPPIVDAEYCASNNINKLGDIQTSDSRNDPSVPTFSTRSSYLHHQEQVNLVFGTAQPPHQPPVSIHNVELVNAGGEAGGKQASASGNNPSEMFSSSLNMSPREFHESMSKLTALMQKSESSRTYFKKIKELEQQKSNLIMAQQQAAQQQQQQRMQQQAAQQQGMMQTAPGFVAPRTLNSSRIINAPQNFIASNNSMSPTNQSANAMVPQMVNSFGNTMQHSFQGQQQQQQQIQSQPSRSPPPQAHLQSNMSGQQQFINNNMMPNNNAHFLSNCLSTGLSTTNQRRASADMIACMPRPMREKRKSMDMVLPNKYQSTESGGRLKTFGEEPLESEQQQQHQQEYMQNNYYAV